MRALVLSFAITSLGVFGAPITLTFDSVSLAPGACGSATSYLGSFGITFVAGTPGASGVICNQAFAGSATNPSSSPNVFFGVPLVTNHDVSYDLLFSTPLAELSFVRTEIITSAGVPAWNAYAYNSANALLDSVGQGFLVGSAAQTFTLVGNGITRLHVDAFNSIGTTFNHPPLDNLTLTPAPELSTWMLSGSMLALLVVFRKVRQTQREPGSSERSL
jgi:hypothetical protein